MNLINLIFPRVCVGCQSIGSYLCRSCKKQLKPHPEICPITHQNSHGYAVRQDLLTRPSPLDGCIVLFRFEPMIKKLILGLKYRHRRDIASFLGERLSLALQSHETLGKCTTSNANLIISYVPSHRMRRYITKGYNQSQLLAQELLRHLPHTVPLQTICHKKKHTHSQVGMSREHRKKNLSDAFEVIAPIPAGSTIIIVDDVLTSGATMIELAKTIKTSQPHCQVWGLCVARNG